MTLKPNSDSLLVGYQNLILFPDPLNSSSSINLNVPVCSTCNRITSIAVSESNPNIMFYSTGKVIKPWHNIDPQDYDSALWKSIDNGNTWVDISANLLGLYDGIITDILVNPKNKDELWVSFGRSTSNADPETTKKIYRSTNGGLSWNAFSTGIPEGIPVSKLKMHKEMDILYAGTDIGIFYRRRDFDTLMPFNNGLPYKVVTDIDINESANRISVGTLGRGIWSTSLLCYDDSPIYISDFQTWSSDQSICTDIIIQNNGTLILLDMDILLPYEGCIYIESGGKLIVDNSILENASIYAKSGSETELLNSSILKVYDNDLIYFETGSECEFGTSKIEFY